MKVIYKFEADLGRMGELNGVFVTTDDDIKTLVENETYVNFGEALGKHSEVGFNMKSEMFKRVTDNEDFIILFEEYNLENGYNPFDYLYE